MRPLVLAPVLFLVATCPSLAQSGVPTTRTDMTPAAPTASSPPDGGRAYGPPNTAAILPPESRTPYSGAGDTTGSRPDPSPPVPGLSSRPVDQVGK